MSPSSDSLFSVAAGDLLRDDIANATVAVLTETRSPIDDILAAVANLPPAYTGPRGYRIHPDTLSAVLRELKPYAVSNPREGFSTLLGLPFIRDASIPSGFARPFDGKGRDMQPDLDLRAKIDQ